MKLIVLLLVASVFSSLAFADTLKIVGNAEITNQNLGEIRVSFGTNKELARAWVEVLLVSQVSLGSDSPPDEQVLRIKLDQLTFDQGTNSILVQTSRGPVLCAHLVRKGFPFRYDTMRMTKECKFDIQKSTVKVTRDDGFNTWVERQTLLNIDLVIAE